MPLSSSRPLRIAAIVIGLGAAIVFASGRSGTGIRPLFGVKFHVLHGAGTDHSPANVKGESGKGYAVKIRLSVKLPSLGTDRTELDLAGSHSGRRQDSIAIAIGRPANGCRRRFG